MRTMHTSIIMNKTTKFNEILQTTKKIIKDNKTYHNYSSNFKKSFDVSPDKYQNSITYQLPRDTKLHTIKKFNIKSPQKRIMPWISWYKKNKIWNLDMNKTINNQSTIETDPFITSNALKYQSVNRTFVQNWKLKANKTNDIHWFSTTWTSKNSMGNRESIFILMKELFRDYTYDDCEYKEDVIYYHEKENIRYLTNKTKDLYSNWSLELSGNSTHNQTSHLEKTFINNQRGDIDLRWTSIKINISDDNSSSKTLIEMPFEYLPMIYLGDNDSLKKWISMILVAESEKEEEEKNKINDDSGISSAQSNKEIELNPKGIDDFIRYYIDSNGKYADKTVIYPNYISSVKDQSVQEEMNNINNNNNQTTSNSLGNETDIQNEFNIDPISEGGPPKLTIKHKNYFGCETLNTSKNILFKTKQKHYYYFWSINNKRYKIEIFFPKIELKLNRNKIHFFKYIDNQLLVYLMERHFRNWDYYVIHYWFSFKNYRNIISNWFAKQRPIKESKCKKLNLTVNKPKETERIILDNILSIKPRCYDWNMNSISFIYTDKINKLNHVCSFNSYVIFIYYSSVNKDSIFAFNFTFSQMKLLYFVSKMKESIKSFILKLLIVTKENRDWNIDYSFFDLFKGLSYNGLKSKYWELYGNDNCTKEDTNNNENKNDIQVKVISPFISILSVNKNNEQESITKCYKTEVDDDVWNQLMINDIEDWVHVWADKGIYEYNYDLEQIRNGKKGFRYSLGNNKKAKHSIIAKNKKSLLVRYFSKNNIIVSPSKLGNIINYN